MELTIKELAPYLPYGLKGIAQDGSNDGAIETIIGWQGSEITTNFDCIEMDSFKPLLRPLSDLTKPITHNGETFVPMEWFEIGDDNNDSLEYDHGNIKLIRSLESLAKNGFVNDVKYLPFGVIEKLLEWHFDIFSFLSNNLAIDLNTIQQC
jgi:hypothetical protein